VVGCIMYRQRKKAYYYNNDEY